MGKDTQRINAILNYYIRIEDAKEEFGNDEEDFMDNRFYHDVCSFYLTQIGENARFLSPETTKKYPEVNWMDMMEIRNTIAHGYEGMDLKLIWSTMEKKIPKLKKTCEKILRESKTSRFFM